MTGTEETGFGEELDDETVQRLAAALADPAEQVAGLQLAVLDRAVERMRAAEGRLAALSTYIEEHKGKADFSLLRAYDLLSIIDGEGDECRG